MCGIIGFTAKENVIPGLLAGLRALEYRGYDSAGIAFSEGGALRTVKAEGAVARLAEKADGLFSVCGIGHTRWATHGAPSERNAHPHGTERVQIVHNGIIENEAELKMFLRENGYTFVSDTDSEVAAKLLDFWFQQTQNPLQAVRKTRLQLKGAYAVGAIFRGFENMIYAFRKDNPLICAAAPAGGFITSDVGAIRAYTDKFYDIAEDETAVVCPAGVTFVSADGKTVQKEEKTALWSAVQAEKGTFPHFMLKEIHEEPDALVQTVREALSDGEIVIGGLKKADLCRVETVHIAACGTAYHAGLIGRAAIESLARIPTRVYYASEFRYMNPILSEHDLVIVVSQSGETADTLAALRLAKQRGIRTLAVVNRPASAMAREADRVFYTQAGPEISVASTKAYHVQVAALQMLAMAFAEARGRMETAERERLVHLLRSDVPDKIRVLADRPFGTLAARYREATNIFFIGRGTDRVQCEEAALKLKEISYIHCEAYAAGELKHGTISLITDEVPVIGILTDETAADKMCANLREVKARGAHVLLFAAEGRNLPEGTWDEVVFLPRIEPLFMPFLCGTATQLLAYEVACALGHDVDKPRNLAKSVTVE